MKKKIIIVICLAAAVIAAIAVIASHQKDNSEGGYFEDDYDKVVTLETALPALEDWGYKKTSEGYKGEDDVDGVSSVRLVTARDNHMNVELSYDYGDGNANMIDYYNENPDNAVSVMISSFLTYVASAAHTDEGDMDYVVYIGGEKILEGSMSLEEAREFQEMSVDETDFTD